MNPLLSSQYYIPDVEARVDQDGTIYLYGSKDIVNDDDYCSNEYQVFYSKDMVYWEAGAISFSTEQMQEKQISGCMRPTVSKKMENIIFCIVWQMERRELQKVKVLLDRLRTEESLRKPMASIPALWLKKIRSIISGARWGSMEQSWISKLVKSGKRHIRPIF